MRSNYVLVPPKAAAPRPTAPEPSILPLLLIVAASSALVVAMVLLVRAQSKSRERGQRALDDWAVRSGLTRVEPARGPARPPPRSGKTPIVSGHAHGSLTTLELLDVSGSRVGSTCVSLFVNACERLVMPINGVTLPWLSVIPHGKRSMFTPNPQTTGDARFDATFDVYATIDSSLLTAVVSMQGAFALSAELRTALLRSQLANLQLLSFDGEFVSVTFAGASLAESDVVEARSLLDVFARELPSILRQLTMGGARIRARAAA